MSNDDDSRIGGRTRRSVLKGLGTAVAFGAATGVASASDGRASLLDDPQTVLDDYADEYSVELGNGRLTTFSSVDFTGLPKFVGVHLSDGALSGLPSAEELQESGEGTVIHGAMSKEFAVPFPDTAPAPFEFLGFNWNPNGHPPSGVHDVPHFDVHFHFEDVETVYGIEQSVADYEIPAERMPQGFARVPSPKTGEYVTVKHMGEHLIDPTTPELNGGEFTNTLLWGAYDLNGDGAGELNFVEPMLTREYLSNLSGEDARPVAQPTVYPYDGWYPNTYTVYDLGTEGLAVVLEDLEEQQV
ncbi:hypothetical protein [Halorussus caseinilyticus]|uniref:DUF5602 domain-containing protein n=1 Tax=Halorussus caseinilyticus TaxID=3034025 RepID=A0ABD5WLR0_9EURY|nr:hypothetical protein [Halorussus sp. DT72]